MDLLSCLYVTTPLCSRAYKYKFSGMENLDLNESLIINRRPPLSHLNEVGCVESLHGNGRVYGQRLRMDKGTRHVAKTVLVQLLRAQKVFRSIIRGIKLLRLLLKIKIIIM